MIDNRKEFRNYYIASCVFTERFPELSEKIRNYVQNNYDVEIIAGRIISWQGKGNAYRRIIICIMHKFQFVKYLYTVKRSGKI